MHADRLLLAVYEIACWSTLVHILFVVRARTSTRFSSPPVAAVSCVPSGFRMGRVQVCMCVCVCKSDIYKNVTELVGSIIVNKCVF